MERQTQFLRSVLLTENLANINEETMLLELLKKNRYNQMAFEFLMARYLMERNVEKIVENLDHFRDFGYREIPTLYEEAILLYENKTEEKVDLRGRHIRPETIERFRKFTEVISSSTLQAREFAATEFTREFGRSYFFYYVFDASGVDR